MVSLRVWRWFKQISVRCRVAFQRQLAHRIHIRLLKADGPDQHADENGDEEADGDHPIQAHSTYAMRQIENVTHSIGGMSLYGVISICLFVAVFVGVLVWTIRLKKSYVNSMRELPLEGDPAADTQLLEPPPNR